MPSANVPAIQYTTFIDAFQKAVAAKQNEIKEMEASQREYMACVSVLRAVPLPNDGKIELTTLGADITIAAKVSDNCKMFDDIAKRIGTTLHDEGLRDDAEAAVSKRASWTPQMSYVFWTNRSDGSKGMVNMRVTFPKDGISDAAVISRTEKLDFEVFEIVPRSEAGAIAACSEPIPG